MYQDGGTTLIDAAKSYEPKAMIYAEGVRRSSELANAINITSRLFSEGTNPKDVAKMLFATASLESDFGTTTQKNHFQIDPPAFKRVFGKNDKGNHTSKQKEYFAKIEALTGLKATDITHEQVKDNPLLSAITARLYYTKSPNAIPTNAQDFANEYLGHYNAGGAQKYQSEEYTKKKAQERFMQASMAIDKMFEDNPGPVANPQERKVTGPTGDTIKFAAGGIPPPPPPPPPLDPANFGEPELEDLNTTLLDTTGVDLTGMGTGGSTATSTETTGGTDTATDIGVGLTDVGTGTTTTTTDTTDTTTDAGLGLTDIGTGGGTVTTDTTTDNTDTTTDIGISLEEAETGGATTTESNTTETEAEVTNTLLTEEIVETGGGTEIIDTGNIDDYLEFLEPTEEIIETGLGENTGGSSETTATPELTEEVTEGGLGEGEEWYNQDEAEEQLEEAGGGQPDTGSGSTTVLNPGGGTEYIDPNLEPSEEIIESIGPANPVSTDLEGNPVLREPQTYIDPSTVQSGLGTQGVGGIYGGAGGGTGTIKGIQRGRRGMGSFGGGFFARQEDDDKVNIFQAAGDIYSSLLRREMKKNKR